MDKNIKAYQDVMYGEEKVKNKLKLPLIIVSIVCVLLLVGSIVLLQFFSETKAELDETNQMWKDAINAKSNYYEELQVYQEDFAYYTKTGTKYHKYHCGHLDGRHLYVNYIKALKREGYEPCEDCY